MKKFYQLICFLIISSPVVAKTKVKTDLSISRANGSIIDYYIYKHSDNKITKELLLILQGSDCNSVLQLKPIFNSYANVWPKADILLVEKYGIDKALAYSANAERNDCPIPYINNDNPYQRLEDIKAVLKTVRADHKYEKLIVLGGSEGAVIANMLAAENLQIDATIAFNGGGRWFIDDVIHSISSDDNQSIQDIENSIKGFNAFSQHIINSEPFELQMSGHGYGWWKQMLSIDQQSLLNKANTPILIVQGGIDKSVSPQKVNEMISALEKQGKNNIEYLFYENLDHNFKDAKDVKKVNIVVSDMNRWLNAVLEFNRVR